MGVNITGIMRKCLVLAVSIILVIESLSVYVYTDAASGIKLNKKNVSMKVGESCTLKVKGKKIKSIKWKSGNKKIASVKKKGKKAGVVKALKAGKCKIKAGIKLTGKKVKNLTCKITVKNNHVSILQTEAPAPVQTQAVKLPQMQETSEPTAGPTITPIDMIPEDELAVVNYPMLFSDIPDPYICRKGDTYYMVSTTMFLNPGIPVMKSTDLVHWQMCCYVYDILSDDDYGNMNNGKDMYSQGSWAASIVYNEEEDYFIVCVVDTANWSSLFFTTDDIESGNWKRYRSDNTYHDSGMLFNNGQLYVFANNGNCEMSKVELIEDDDGDGTGSARRIGDSKRIIESEKFGGIEGWHAYHIGDYYYLISIGSPNGMWFRTAICYRTDDLENGKWEEQVIYSGPSGGFNQGLAQGGIIDTIYGEWYGYLFQDHGSVGRCPSVVQIDWDYTDEDGVSYKDWPMMGTYDSDGVFHPNVSEEEIRINLKDSGMDNYIWGDDDFNYKEGEPLKLIWQWNHNPDPDNWSLTENPGYYRIRSGRIAQNVYGAINSLTQRTYGPYCTSEIRLNVDGLKPGDYAGLCAFQDSYGIIGVTCDSDGKKYIIQGEGKFNEQEDGYYNKVPVTENERVSEALTKDEVVVKIEYDFSYTYNSTVDKANFYYSLDDGNTWNILGKRLNITNDYTTVFMGARSYLFMYSTEQTGGYADFDYYKVYD